VILFIDELHMLVGAGGAEGTIDASNMLKPALARSLQCVGATTLTEYRKHIEKDAALARRFQTVLVTEPTVTDTLAMLRGLKERYELHHGVRIADAALVAAVSLSDRYITVHRNTSENNCLLLLLLLFKRDISRPFCLGSIPARQSDRRDRRSGVAAAHRDAVEA
jgi:ATP-dependent Clp protease ATP-binding subunit ClpA